MSYGSVPQAAYLWLGISIPHSLFPIAAKNLAL